MEIKEFKIYEFHELDITTQRKVIDGFIADGIFDEDCDYLEDEYVDRLSSFGIDDVKLEYSVGFCQGDYASFNGNIGWDDSVTFLKSFDDLDGEIDEICKLIDSEKINLWGEICNNRYSMELELEYEIDVDDEDEFRILDDMVYKFIEKYKYRILEGLYGIANEFYDKCRDEYLYQISDRYIIDMIESNEYRFFEDGRVVI